MLNLSLTTLICHMFFILAVSVFSPECYREMRLLGLTQSVGHGRRLRICCLNLYFLRLYINFLRYIKENIDKTNVSLMFLYVFHSLKSF